MREQTGTSGIRTFKTVFPSWVRVILTERLCSLFMINGSLSIWPRHRDMGMGRCFKESSLNRHRRYDPRQVVMKSGTPMVMSTSGSVIKFIHRSPTTGYGAATVGRLPERTGMYAPGLHSAANRTKPSMFPFHLKAASLASAGAEGHARYRLRRGRYLVAGVLGATRDAPIGFRRVRREVGESCGRRERSACFA